MVNAMSLTETHNDIWDARWTAAALATSGSEVRELLKLTEKPDFISFAGGLPAPETFPAEELAAAAERALAEHAARVLQYGPSEGYGPLRAAIAEIMTERGAPVTAAQVVVTSGSQQALDVLARLLVEPGDPIIVEAPTYMGALQAWRPYRPTFVPVPIDTGGMQIAPLAATLQRMAAEGRPARFIYTVAAFQNPSGVTLAADRRDALLDLAEQYDIPVVEDDPYGELRFEGVAPPLLTAIDVQRHGAPRYVLYTSTFSKLLAPGLRIGWITGPDTLLHKFVQVRQGVDLHTGSLSQAIAYEACKERLPQRNLPRILALYRERRDTMLAALEREMPQGVSWTRPEGGMFLWVTLPAGADSPVLLRQAVERGVAFIPGTAFFTDGGGREAMRVNFSYSTPAQINDGIARLAALLREQLV